MPIEVIMPKVDMDMASGVISAWHVEIGATVAKGDPLFDIETDKAAMEVEAQSDGILHHPIAEGTEVAIGQPVAWLYAADEVVGDAPEGERAASAPAAQDTSDNAFAEADQVAASAVPLTDKIRATPRARSLAREAGLDITTLTGSGPRNRIQAEDVPSKLHVNPSLPASFVPENGPLSVTHKKGSGGTPIVLIHGFASDSKSWAPLEHYLADCPLIRIDLPCHGKSPNLRITGFADLVTVVRQTFDDLHLEAAQLIGHSLGGAVALALADTRARKIKSLNLIAPGGLGPDINTASLNGITNATRVESLTPWLKMLVHDEALITEGYARAVMATRINANMRAAQMALADAVFPDGTQAFDLRAALQRVEMPTRVIWGRQDRIIKWQHALNAPGDVALHLFDATGHMPQIEHTDEIGKLLKSAL
ncbi:MAG: acetoin dehydrogenase dihydrolipoyllysine-residue acetyltransferase subunit [Paracoccaceae bacterium]|nr:acetoin dehydrogenase dihydrolipoyllysine-residue acetyltransferase subunit [Paracoccaceae bacterium]